jgi:hypothetical protein
MVGADNYVQATRDPETGEVSFAVNPALKAAHDAEQAQKIALTKAASPYQTWQMQNGDRKQDYREDSGATKMSETERHNRANEYLAGLGYDQRTRTAMLNTGLAYGKAGADVPDGYDAPLTGGQVSDQAPQSHVGGYTPEGLPVGLQRAYPGARMTSGYRSPAEQAALVARGVTGATHSKHNDGNAIDMTFPGMGPGHEAEVVANLRAQGIPARKALYESGKGANQGTGAHYHIDGDFGLGPSGRSVPAPAATPRTISVPRVAVKPKASAAPKGYYQPKSKAEFDALPSGTHFIAPDGSARIKP